MTRALKHFKELVSRGLFVGVFITTFPITRRFISYDYLFFTYAATSEDSDKYGPAWFRNLFPPMVPIGWISRGGEIGRGLVLGTTLNAGKFEDRKMAESLKDLLLSFLRKTGAKSISLGGRLPSVLTAAGIDLDPPFVYGKFGTVYILQLSIRHFVEKKGLVPKQTVVGILGIGFIGSALACFLADHYKQVVAVDIRKSSRDEWPEKVIYTTDASKLQTCDIVVILTARGDDAESAISQLKQDVLVLDDAHPQLSAPLISRIRNEKKGEVYKAAVRAPGVRFIQRLPGFNPEWLPGCAIEAMVAARFGNSYKTQAEFNDLGDRLGFEPLEIFHRKKK